MRGSYPAQFRLQSKLRGKIRAELRENYCKLKSARRERNGYSCVVPERTILYARFSKYRNMHAIFRLTHNSSVGMHSYSQAKCYTADATNPSTPTQPRRDIILSLAPTRRPPLNFQNRNNPKYNQFYNEDHNHSFSFSLPACRHWSGCSR
jgi:hypothetical protein